MFKRIPAFLCAILLAGAVAAQAYTLTFAAVRDLVDDSVGRAGFLLAGIYSEAGYEDWVSVGGGGSTHPAILEVELQGVVAGAPSSWSRIKTLYR